MSRPWHCLSQELRMAFSIRHQESVPTAMRRIARSQLKECLTCLIDRQPDVHTAVHDFRKGCKKMRGLVRLIRPSLSEDYHRWNGAFRDWSQSLAFLRDAQAQLETLDRLELAERAAGSTDEIGEVRAMLESRRDAAAGAGEGSPIDRAMTQLVNPLRAARNDVERWQIKDDGFEVVAPGLLQTYRRARRAMQRAYADPTDHHFHEWRKGIKYHWHHSLLLRAIQPRLLRPHRQLADELAELLGQDHDCAVLREQLQTLDGSSTFQQQRVLVIRWIHHRQRELRREMQTLGAYVHAESPTRLTNRWRAYWQAWQSAPSETTRPPQP